MKPTQILWFGGSDWWVHNTYSEKRYARIYAREGDTVLFVNSISIGVPALTQKGSWLRIFKKFASLARLLRKAGDRLYVLSPVLVPMWSVEWIARLNRFLLRAQVALAMKRIGMRRPLAVFAIPTAAVLLGRIDVSGILYYVKDNYSSYHEHLRFSNIVEHDRLLLERADAIVCASVSLWEEYRTRYRDVRWVPHGVSRVFLDTPATAEPEALRAVPHPRIMYWGLIDRQIDAALIMELARRRPEWHFLLLGPKTDVAEEDLRAPNIHLYPRSAQETIVAFGRECDVLMIPRKDSEWNRFACPTKLREYLAVGKPVVSVPVYEFDRLFPGAIRVGVGSDAWDAAIEDALAERNPARNEYRRSLVASYSVEEASKKFRVVIDSMLSEPAREGAHDTAIPETRAAAGEETR